MVMCDKLEAANVQVLELVASCTTSESIAHWSPNLRRGSSTAVFGLVVLKLVILVALHDFLIEVQVIFRKVYFEVFIAVADQ